MRSTKDLGDIVRRKIHNKKMSTAQALADTRRKLLRGAERYEKIAKEIHEDAGGTLTKYDTNRIDTLTRWAAHERDGPKYLEQLSVSRWKPWVGNRVAGRVVMALSTLLPRIG